MLGMLISCMPFVRHGSGAQNVLTTDRDPAYRVYQRYRYAYEKYGYLFFSSEGKQGENPDKNQTEPRTDTDTPAGENASGPQHFPDSGAPQANLPSLAQLQDYDYLMNHFYSVHASTTAPRSLMQAQTLLGTDLSLVQDPNVPQILIYHTHSQEEYADQGADSAETGVVRIGNHLTELLRERGWNVIHDTSAYDMQGGELDRNRAYTYALDGITKLLEKYPSVQVVLDLHRDGVSSKTRLVSTVNGKKTANIMFFQGMSRTPEGEIAYLPNPNLPGNLAFSFQMQCAAARYYPGFTRKIYMKGLRYNLHLRPRSALIEVGAQTNTLEEAMNAMEPLAEVLDMVLRQNAKNDIFYDD
jgi:stage II sporulation protein P